MLYQCFVLKGFDMWQQENSLPLGLNAQDKACDVVRLRHTIAVKEATVDMPPALINSAIL
jgi:hypothetical protein